MLSRIIESISNIGTPGTPENELLRQDQGARVPLLNTTPIVLHLTEYGS